MGEEFFVEVIISRKSMWIPCRGCRFRAKRRYATVLAFIAERALLIE
jgi:hypothetical protein